jgi:ABC-type antimicrobial peptide transport system permease subunit
MAGIYGVMSYAAAIRRREYGIRLALGADAARLLRLVLAQGGLLVAAGVTIGVAGAVAVTRILGALLYGVTPTDPLTFIAAALLLAGVAMLACLNPAYQAMKLDPMTILRHE